MKKIKNKLIKVLANLYGLGITAAVFMGALSFAGYLAAIVIGGQAAADICTFIYKKLYPILFYVCSTSVFIGMLKMYIAGEKSMMLSKKSNQKEKGNT